MTGHEPGEQNLLPEDASNSRAARNGSAYRPRPLQRTVELLGKEREPLDVRTNPGKRPSQLPRVDLDPAGLSGNDMEHVERNSAERRHAEGR